MNTIAKAGRQASGASQRNDAEYPTHDYVGSKARLRADLKTLVADAATVIKEAAACPADGFATLRTRFEKKLLEAKEQVGRARLSVNEKAHRATAATHAYVKANPWQVAGIFAAAGLIFGIIMARRGPLSNSDDREEE